MGPVETASILTASVCVPTQSMGTRKLIYFCRCHGILLFYKCPELGIYRSYTSREIVEKI